MSSHFSTGEVNILFLVKFPNFSSIGSIITSAHSVADEAHVIIVRHSNHSSERIEYSARVVAVDRERDLAELAADSPHFWQAFDKEGAQGLRLAGSWPSQNATEQTATVVGYPEEDDSIKLLRQHASAVQAGVPPSQMRWNGQVGSEEVWRVDLDRGFAGGPVILNNVVVGVVSLSSLRSSESASSTQTTLGIVC